MTPAAIAVISFCALAGQACSLPNVLLGARSSLRSDDSHVRVSWQLGAGLAFRERGRVEAGVAEPLAAIPVETQPAPCEVALLCAFEEHERRRALREAAPLFAEDP